MWDNSAEARRKSAATYRDKTYRANRLVILRRANGRCEECGKRARLEVDHIVPVSAGGGHDLANLQALCRADHARKTGEQHGWRSRGQAPADPSPTPKTQWT